MSTIQCLAFVLLSSILGAQEASPADPVLDLTGEWRFALDPEDVGTAAAWFESELPDRIQLPGTLQAQGYGNEVAVDTAWTAGVNDRGWFTDEAMAAYRAPGKVKIPFWLQPARHYVGAAWYQREVVIPEDWAGRRIVLELERCHWTSRVWVDGVEAGFGDSLSTPHVFDLSPLLVPGMHTLTLCIDNRMHVDVGNNAHSVSDHTQSNWNGVVGDLRLRSMPPVWIEDVQVYPDVKGHLARVHVTIGQLEARESTGSLSVQAIGRYGREETGAPALSKRIRITQERETVEVDYPLGDNLLLWDEFQPARYDLETRIRMDATPIRDDDEWLELELELQKLVGETGPEDVQWAPFGMREVTTPGTQIAINGRPIFLRGTLECCIFPRTGHPPTDVAAWRRIFRICREHGLNHVRFHSWCPPEAAFVAADELGFYLQVEAAAWATVGNGAPVDAWIREEARRILRTYGNHPSFLMLAYGNEPGGAKQGAYLTSLVEEWKRADQRHLYTTAAGWPILPASDYHSTPTPRIHAWGAGLQSRINARPPETTTDYRDFVAQHDAPVVSHEIGQWCVYPDFGEIAKYTGYLKPKNFEIFRDTLAANHMADQAHDFLLASGKLQLACYKEEIESALRTPGFGGFQLLDLHDFPGQGTALVGVLDPFWNSKPYCTPFDFRLFCGETVPLARMEKRIFTSDEKLVAEIEVAHYGPVDLEQAVVMWRLASTDSEVYATGELPPCDLPTGSLTHVGRVELPLADFPSPRALRLLVFIEGTAYRNGWQAWVYAPEVSSEPPANVVVTRDLDDALAHLEAGKRVLWNPAPGGIETDVALGFSSIFWNTSWTRGQPPHTLGILCDPGHAALASFPTEDHSDWQWWYPVSHAAAFPLGGFPPALRPIVQVVPDWFTNERLALVFEGRVGEGRLLVSSIDLLGELSDPVVRQLRRSLLDYAASDAFAPTVPLHPALLRSRVRTPSELERRGATATADSAMPGFPAALAIDGDPTTFWHTPWGEGRTELPHWLTIDLRETTTLTGIVCVPRQDMANGRVADFEVYVGDDANELGAPVLRGTWPDDGTTRELRFPAPASGRYVRLVARSEVNGNFFTALAELDVLLD